jgi:hypothetical protein
MSATQFLRLEFSLPQTELSFDRKRQKILAEVRQHEIWKIEGKLIAITAGRIAKLLLTSRIVKNNFSLHSDK